MAIPLFQVDAFTDRPFSGNPAAICLLDAQRDRDWMQAVAAEMNLSETAFVEPRPDGFGLRWFTPRVEVALCGHATLAAAHVLWEAGRLHASQPARFHTRSGLLPASRRDGIIELDFPARPAEPEPAPDGLATALGVEPRAFGRSAEDWLVEVADAAQVRALRPDLAAIATLPVRGLVVTAAAAPADECDFVSRFFAPAVGVDEDPVTGSAHCCLAPWWGSRLGRSDMVGRQVGPRGGTVRVRLAGDRVVLGGHAVTVLRGELLA